MFVCCWIKTIPAIIYKNFKLLLDLERAKNALSNSNDTGRCEWRENIFRELYLAMALRVTALKRNDKRPLFSLNSQKYCYFQFYPRTSTTENWFKDEWEQRWILSHQQALGFSWKPASQEAAGSGPPQPEGKSERHRSSQRMFGHCVDQKCPPGKNVRGNTFGGVITS